MWIALGLAIFLAVAGTVYATTAYEWRGTVMLLVCAVAFLYIALVLRGAVRRASVPGTQERMATEEHVVESEHIGPTIWPFVFSLAALLLVVGVVGLHWVLIPGAILFAGAAAGWFRDIKLQWHPNGSATAHAEMQGPATSVSTLEGKQQSDDDHRE
jgi:Cytochrome c oxidase subunit IV